MSDLPRYIADLCGVMDDNEVILGWGQAQMRNPIQMAKHKDGCWTLAFNGEEIGWISPISVKSKDGNRYRAVSVHGAFKHTRSLSEARSFIMAEFH